MCTGNMILEIKKMVSLFLMIIISYDILTVLLF